METNPHSGKAISDPDVQSILIHSDELMAMIGYLRTILGDEWDYPSCTDQEIFDLYLYHRFDVWGQLKRLGMKIEPSTNAGSHCQGSLNVSYDRIVEVLGEPNTEDDDSKVTHFWSYTVDGQEVAIWDYKGARWSYYGDRALLERLFGKDVVQPGSY